jgi:Protein of unknown function (DUF4242)
MKLIHSACLLGMSFFAITSCTDESKKAPEEAVAKTIVSKDTTAPASYYIDVHDLEPGKVTFDAVKGAHEKDLATQGKYDVKFVKYWVDEAKGKVYCLSQAHKEEDITATHKEAHGLLPSSVYQVSEGTEVALAGNKNIYLDVHELGAGKVTAKDVAGAHEKDLAVQGKNGVNFVNYWVDEKKGVVMCLSEAADSNSVKKTHQEAHGLVPAYVLTVKQGQ